MLRPYFCSISSSDPLFAAVTYGLIMFFFALIGMGQEVPDTDVLRLYGGSGTIEVISEDGKVREISTGELREISKVVRKGETVRTGKDSYAVMLKGERIGMRLGVETTVDTRPDVKAGHSLSLLRGKLNVKVRSLKDKKRRQEFRLKMPSTVLAVKGTSFFGEVTGELETGGVNDGQIEVVRLINGNERKAAVTGGNALDLNREGVARMRKLSREEIGYQRFYGGLEKALDNREKASERGFVELCRIPAGRFQMSDAKIDVTITKDFWIGKYEVTQKEYEEIMGVNPAKFKQAGNMAPVETVSWLDAMEFCRKLTEREQQNGTLPEGWVYHLPTEAQWDYASRAGSKTAYSFGDDRSRLGEFAWFEDNGGGMTHSVGRKKPNEWGLHDVHGNVWEWCRDWFGDLSGGKDPEGAASGTFRVTRGGCWKNNATFCRSVSRNWTPPAERNNILGFRVALVPSGTVAGSSDQ